VTEEETVMPYWKWTAYMILAGITAILVLGRLPLLEHAAQQLRVKTAMTVPSQILSDDNLADAMAGLRLQERLTRVVWDHSILTADLTLRSENGSAQGVVRDLTSLIRFSYGEAGNVRQLLFRVYMEKGGKRLLLFYGDSRREDWTSEELASMQPSISAADEAFGRKLRLIKTAAGERWFRNLSN
jgi:hypothetical protein